MFQGQFFMFEDDRESRKPSSYNINPKIFPPKIHLLDHETDKFVEQKMEINIPYSFDTFKIFV